MPSTGGARLPERESNGNPCSARVRVKVDEYHRIKE